MQRAYAGVPEVLVGKNEREEFIEQANIQEMVAGERKRFALGVGNEKRLDGDR